ncbi:MAG: hypothetical protein K5981_01235 [Clostridia bacterium]|nr:hypothetical protein [Clostridia bacterium]
MFEQVIEGQGYIVLIGKNYTDWFFEMFIKAALKIPASVPLVGGMTLVGAELGVSTKKIWGAFEALKLGIGVTYYWGESTVHFGTASDKAQPTYPNLLLNGYDAKGEGVPVAYDAENDRTLYARFGTNFEAPRTAQVLGADDLVLMDASGVWSDGGRVSHKFNLGSYNAASNAAAAVQFNYEAESLEQAKALASGFTVKDGANAAFPLALYDGANADSANANITWDEATGTATFAFTVTDESQYDKDWFVSTGSTPADVVLYNVLPLPELTGVSAPAALAAGGSAAVTWDGTGLDELDSVSFFLAKSMDPTEDDGAGYPLTSAAFPGGVDDSAVIQSRSVTLTVPADIPAGDYYLRAVYAKDDQVNGSIYGTATIAVSNANMPAAIGTPSVSAAGDLRYGVEIPQTSDANTAGYSVTIYDEDGSATDIAGLTFDKAASGATSFEIGGSYTAPVRADADNAESALTGTAVYGLEGGKNYSIGITPYKTVDADGDGEDDTIVYGAEYKTAAIALPEAVTPTATLTAEGKTIPAMTAAEAAAVGTAAPQQAGPAFTVSDLTVTAAFSEPVSGTWTLDSSDLWETMDDDAAVTAGTFDNAASAQIALTGLAEGNHTLTLEGSAADGDRFAYEYPFTVDTTAPRLLLSSPLNGSPFNADGTVTIAGVTDHNATLFVSVDGQPATAFIPEPDMAGVFSLSAAIPQANGAAAHKLTIYAADPLGNRTADKAISLVHPGLGDLQELILKVDGTVPASGAINTETAGTAALSLWGVTSDGTEFALDPDRIQWRAIAAEGAATVGYGGALAYEAFTKGFVEAMLEVTEGAYRTASLALYAEADKRLVTVSAGEGGSVSGGGYYEVGERAFLLATPNEGYSFDHWEVTGATVADATSAALSFVLTEGGDITARAVFRVNEYTITWKNYDGSIIDTTSVGYGSIPSHAAPERPGDAEHTYTFAGWTPELVAVTGPATYTATFTDSTNVYTITWQDEDGQLIDTTTVAYGAVPTHADPAKSATAEFTYAFAGWSPAVETVTGDATYTATYTETRRNYTVTWNVEGVQTQETYAYGETPVFKGTLDKAPTEQYSYTFTGWSPAVEAVTGDASYTAQYSQAVRSYTITWKNDDGSVIDTTEATYGSVPEHAAAVKEATDEFYYTFAGWTPALQTVRGDATYTATYTEVRRSYVITWLNEDGTLIDTTTVEYGAMPGHAAPTKPSDAEHTYTFAGWTPEVAAVTGPATYRATFTGSDQVYTITWKDEDGSVIDTTTVAYGAMPSHVDPAKEATAEYTYTFAGWTPALQRAEADAAYTAVFTAVKRTYTITWLNEDGTLIDKTAAEYGSVPAHAALAKAATEEYTYVFAGWTPEVAAVTGEATYKAVFTAEKNAYTVTWNVDGKQTQETYEYGETPVFKGSTDKPATAEYTYTFDGWTPAIAAVTGDATYTAQYSRSERTYDIRWLADDGSLIDVTSVKYGAVPAHADAVKAQTAEYTYVFAGWTPALAAVTGEASYTATFRAVRRSYTVTWIVDGVESQETYEYGAMPSFKGTPEKADTAEYRYTFAGWTPEIASVTGDASYTAVFDETARKRLGVTGTTVAEGSVTVTFVNEIEPGAVAIVALYDESGRFIGIMTQELPVGEETPLTVPTEDYADPDTAGVFIVNADMKPEDAEVIILLDEDRP